HPHPPSFPTRRSSDLALPALAGKFGVAGGGLVGGAGHAFPKTLDKLTRSDFVPPKTRTINILDVSRLLLDDNLEPPIKALFIYKDRKSTRLNSSHLVI